MNCTFGDKLFNNERDLVRSKREHAWNAPREANSRARLSRAFATLTAESLKAYVDETRPTIRSYWLLAICLAAVIIPFSLASFVSSSISSAIRTEIATANDLPVKLRAQLGPPPAQTGGSAAGSASALPPGLNLADAIAELQQFASTIRAIGVRGRQLNVLMLQLERDPFAGIRKDPIRIHKTFQLPRGLPNLAAATDERIDVYQDVRYFAQTLVDNVSFFYGAISTCVLPVLYALLGTCAYLLRTFDQQMTNRTFVPSAANSARFLIAGIGGSGVGLFNFNITQTASIPPLAIAFLVGYAVDVFFAFLEGLLRAPSPKTVLPRPSRRPHLRRKLSAAAYRVQYRFRRNPLFVTSISTLPYKVRTFCSNW